MSGFRPRWWLRYYLAAGALFGLPIKQSIIKRGLVIAVLALLTACPAPHVVQRDADAARAPTADNACSNLAAIGCLEGASPACVAAIGVEIEAGVREVDLVCLANAQTKEAARACAGGVTCP